MRDTPGTHRVQARDAGDRPLALEQARVYCSGEPPRDFETFWFKTNLSPPKCGKFFNPETVAVLEPAAYIEIAERSFGCCRL